MVTMSILDRICIEVLVIYKLENLAALKGSLNFASSLRLRYYVLVFVRLFHTLFVEYAIFEKLFNDFRIGK